MYLNVGEKGGRRDRKYYNEQSYVRELWDRVALAQAIIWIT